MSRAYGALSTTEVYFVAPPADAWVRLVVTTAAGRERRSHDLPGRQGPAEASEADPRRDTRRTATGGVRTLLTIEAAADRLGVTPRMVRRLVNERRIGFVRVGKFIRFRPDDLDAYLDQNFQPPHPSNGR